MALFNRLFPSRKKSCYKGQDAVCENFFILTKEQVRVLLFRECDFRGRKLLFDSESVQRVALSARGDLQEREASSSTKCNDKYEEVSNGYGYQYIKPCCDIGHLGEMVFGAVAMSYRGTSLKIHSLKSPSRLMCSQIFPSPRHTSRRCHSTSSQSCARSSVTSCQSLEQSIRLDNSGTSSMTFGSDQLSLHSDGSDALLVCRGPQSVPLDVPVPNPSTNYDTNLTPSVIGDSGFSGEQSCNSIGSVLQSFPLCCPLHEGEQGSFSCGSLYKKWLRSTSTSLEHSSTSLAGSDECILKSHPRRTKLGLAIIIELPYGQEQFMELFLMEHASLIESMVWKARQGVELAYARHGSFVSLMFDVAMNVTQWLIDLLSGPLLSNHLWISLAPICDNLTSIKHSDNVKNSFNEKCSNSYSAVDDTYRNNKDVCLTMSLNVVKDKCATNGIERKLSKQHSCVSLNNLKCEDCFFDTPQTQSKSADFTFLNLTRFLRNEFSSVGVKNGYAYDDKNFMAEKYITELCELLDCIDIKHTNFFISTLVTAVLTHHLGWVNTVLPPSLNDTEKVAKLHNPCNPLWGQLTDLYGAIGHPTKVSHTIITGTNKSELISKILNSLTYFIRCNDVNRKCLTRFDIKEDNKMVDCICQQNSCIPKENYKKYEDHLREIEIANNNIVSPKKSDRLTNLLNSKNELESNPSENIEMRNINHSAKENSNPLSETTNIDLELKSSKRNGLMKTPTCLSDLYKMEVGSSTPPPNRLYPCLEELHQTEDLTPVMYGSTSPHMLLDKVKKLGIHAVDSLPLDKQSEYQLTNAIINEKVRKLCRVPASALLYHTEVSQDQLVNIHEASIQVNKTFAPQLINMEKQMKSADCTESYVCSNNKEEEDCNKKNVIFVLGDDEELVGLRKKAGSVNENSLSQSYLPSEDHDDAQSQDGHTAFCTMEKRGLKQRVSNVADVKPSTSWTSGKVVTNCASTISLESEGNEVELQKELCHSQSVPPEGNKLKYRYSGVKFNIQQYPQIVTNYMRSKNLDLSQMHFSEKAMKFNNPQYPEFDFSNCSNQVEEIEILQTPSNASELEFTSDLVMDNNCDVQHAKEVLEWRPKTFVRNQVPNTVIKEPHLNFCAKTEVIEHPLQKNDTTNNNAMFEYEECNSIEKFNLAQQYKLDQMQVVELPMPKSEPVKLDHIPVNYTSSLMRGIGERYISNMVLQGTSAPKSEWESSLRKDLSLAARYPLLDQPVDEAIAIVANTDTWEVQLLSSHTYVVDRGSSGIRVGMSQLVANMLETLLQMWKLRTPPQYCIMHIEQKLQEFCVLSQSLAELLLATEFCSMDLLTSVLQLEINDVPLLMAVASTHSPQLAQKYGLSFQ